MVVFNALMLKNTELTYELELLVFLGSCQQCWVVIVQLLTQPPGY